MNTAITTRENDRNIAAAALLRHDPSETEGVDFFDEIADDGSVIAPHIVAAADRNGYSPAALCEMVAEAAAENAGLNGYSRSERAIIKAGRLHGEDVVITRPRRRTH
jgi:hypothetical protein